MNTTFTTYWNIVLRSLVQLCGLPQEAARQRVRDLRRRLQETPSHLRRDMINRQEPYRLALTLAGSEETELSAELGKYHRLAAEASVTGTDEEVREYQVAL
ncbi:MAG: hypothetical protein JWM59_1069 [Verrucomicrobiales bacterium]|nr:hypothetical protein [Verrucomicrobiales bacterium]